MLSEELLFVKEWRPYIALSSKPNSCHLHEFSCGCLQTVIAAGRGVCWHSFIEAYVEGSWKPPLCIQPCLPTSCMQLGPTCSSRSDLREGLGYVRRLGKDGSIYGEPIIHDRCRPFCVAALVSPMPYLQPLTDTLEVSPVTSEVGGAELCFVIGFLRYGHGRWLCRCCLVLIKERILKKERKWSKSLAQLWKQRGAK